MRVAVSGAGYVGLVTAVGLAHLGHEVTIAEVDAARRQIIQGGRAPFFEPGLDDLLQALLARGLLRVAETTALAASAADLSIIAVGTPDRAGKIDLAQVRHAALDIGAAMRVHQRPHTIVVKSTVVPGTTEDVVLPLIEAASGRPRSAFGIAMNPEFLREGTALDDFMAPDRIVIGADDASAERALLELYAGFDCPKIVTNTRSAEMTKYMNNALLGTLVSFSNEMAGYGEAVGSIDFDAVIAGVHADRRLSPPAGERPGILSYLKPSAGFGGSCLPKDIAALRTAAREAGLSTPVLDGVADANERRAAAIVGLLAQVLTLQDARVALLGAAFKAGTDDLRFAASRRVADILLRRQAAVRVHDPLCRPEALAQAFGPNVAVETAIERAVAGADAVIVLTAEPAYREAPWDQLARTMRGRTLVDIWNICGAASRSFTILRPGFGVRVQPEEWRHVAG